MWCTLAYRSSLFPELFQRSFSELGSMQNSQPTGTFLCNQTFFNGAATENAKYLIGAGFIPYPAHRLHLCGQRDY